jgi:hypothetical protein
MRSMADAQDTPIGLAVCDANDPLQQGQALQTGGGNGGFRFQNMGRGISNACLTEGSNNVLVQRACQDKPGQLWSIKDNTTGQFVSPF